MTVVCFNAVASEPRPLTAWLLHIEQWNGKYIWGWLCSASDCCLGLQTRGFGGAHNHDHTSQTTLCLYCLSLAIMRFWMWLYGLQSTHPTALSSSSCSIRVSAVVKISHLPGLSVASAPLPPPSTLQTSPATALPTRVLQLWHRCTSLYLKLEIGMRVCKTFTNRHFGQQRSLRN